MNGWGLENWLKCLERGAGRHEVWSTHHQSAVPQIHHFSGCLSQSHGWNGLEKFPDECIFKICWQRTLIRHLKALCPKNRGQDHPASWTGRTIPSTSELFSSIAICSGAGNYYSLVHLCAACGDSQCHSFRADGWLTVWPKLPGLFFRIAKRSISEYIQRFLAYSSSHPVCAFLLPLTSDLKWRWWMKEHSDSDIASNWQKLKIADYLN